MAESLVGRLPGKGWLALIGGGEFSFEETEGADAAWLSKRPLDPENPGEVGFVPAASGSEDYASHFAVYFDEFFDRAVTTLPVYRARDARRGKNARRVADVADLYLAGGVADHLLDALDGTPTLDAMREKLAAGGTVAAIAAAAQSLGVAVRSLLGGKVLAGLGWLPGGVVETNFEPGSASERRLRQLLGDPRARWGLGIAASSVVMLGPQGEIETVGNAWLLDGPEGELQKLESLANPPKSLLADAKPIDESDLEAANDSAPLN